MQRIAQLERWLEGVLGHGFAIAPASSDASFRRYFRVSRDGASWIAMDAPPQHEDCRPFLHVARLFRDAGVHVPQVHAEDLAQGFLLLSDLGSVTYLDALDAESAGGLYRDALDALLAIQQASRPGLLPDYDHALLLREMRLFPDWYLARHAGVELAADERNALEGVFAAVIRANLGQPQVFVHRDYHCRNLMVSQPNPGVLDFQDAVYGPATYDLVSLFRDAYIEWQEERVLDWVIRYWERARKAGLPLERDFSAFWRDFEWMGVQRHVKVLGIFARLWHRDGKSGYLVDMPLVARYLRRACERYGELSPLLRLLDRAEARQAQVGYTF